MLPRRRVLSHPAFLTATGQSSTRRFLSSARKDITIGAAARNEILKGCDILADAVSVTLGPKGRNVIIEQPYGPPKITKDGVTVAKAIDLGGSSLRNIGAQLVKSVASATNDSAGDGTTTATVLTRAIVKEGLEAVAAGVNPRDLLAGIQLAVDKVNQILTSNSRSVTTSDEIQQVATISSNGDKVLGGLIAEAMARVGQDGVISVNEGKKLTHEVSFVDGFSFDRGYLSPFFMTDPKSRKCELENCRLLLVDSKINSVNQIVPVLEQLVTQPNESLLILAEDVDSEVLTTLLVNRLRVGLNVCIVKAPGYGDYRRGYLEDIAILSGGFVISDSGLSTSLERCSLDRLGFAKKVVVSRDNTLLLETHSVDEQKKSDHIAGLKVLLDSTESEYEKEKVKERIARLQGGVAVIKVGGASELEVGEVKDRVTDALNATRAAIEEGILPGGGSALIYASVELDTLRGHNDGENSGIRIIKKAIRAPTRQIADNAGYEGIMVVGEMLKEHKFGHGFNALSGESCDLLRTGIVDPTKVVRTALKDAASVASLILTTEATVCNAPEPVQACRNHDAPGSAPSSMY